ncbi:MAG: hypothetical protein SFV81_23300, partial [Pirellulaceae bacterium]|nr:hypothetical protein [Pirellulaceae bacterium]
SKARELATASPLVAAPSVDDRSYVAPASANAPEPNAPQAGFTIKTVEQTVGGQSVKWGVERDGVELRLLTSSTIIVKGEAIRGDTISYSVNEGNPVPVSIDIDNTWNTAITVTRPGNSKIVFTRTSGSENAVRFFNAVAPTEDDSRLLQPVITKVSNNAFRTPITLQPQAEPVRLYGGYVSLSGLRVLSGTRLQFAVFDKTGKFLGLALPSTPVNPRPDASWDAELDIVFPPEMAPSSGTTGFMRAMAFSSTDGLHRFSDSQINFQVAPAGTPSTRPRITVAPTLGNGTAEFLKPNQEYLSKDKRFVVKGAVTTSDSQLLGDSRVVVFVNNVPVEVRDIAANPSDQNKWSATIEVSEDNKYVIEAATVLGRSLYGDRSPASKLHVRAAGPRVVSVAPTNAALDGIRVVFDEKVKFEDSSATSAALNSVFLLQGRQANNNPQAATAPAPTQDAENAIVLTYSNVPPDVYKFTVKGQLVKNMFGTAMGADFETQLFRPIGAEEPMTSRGITGPTGPFVTYGEYTKPRDFIDGFNPSDKVETRISRLYYFRDAHRVAQIINRDAKSYNRSAVEMQQQLASKAHQIADQATDDRRAKERNAVQAAQKTREAEQELQQAQQLAQSASNQAAAAQGDLQQANSQLRSLPPDSPNRSQLEANASNLSNAVGSLEKVAESARSRAQAASNKVQQLREEEARVREQWQASIAVEDRAREEQFRREVAAAHADPDTFAPGTPGSQDPVQQVSVSVIGEGLIQLRGPIKGINIIRNMINQIDAPVGQVRVGVHTVQINGEKGDRMEIVAGKIQRFIDHSRFLTLQSAEMLRKAIVRVAAQRAIECGSVPGLSQGDRDRSYLYSFFGEDFVRELETMDSEFLATGNKLLSIHSMDSTSLASALFLMALAKNTTRMQIQQEFEAMMTSELPAAEQNYFEAGLTCDGKHKLFDKHCHRAEFALLSQNARFQSIRGMFNADVAEDDTMTPIQREFIRLAQIFKSRLIVELELKQRVMERAVIEERLGNRQKELTDARFKEENANLLKQRAQDSLKEAQKGTLVASRQLSAIVQSSQRQSEQIAIRARDSKVDSTTKIEAITDNLLKQIRNLVDEEVWMLTGKTPLEQLKLKLLLPLKDGETIAGRIVDFRNNELTWFPGKTTNKWPPSNFFIIPDWPPARGGDPTKNTVELNMDTPGKILFSAADEAERIELETTVASYTAFAVRTKSQLEAWPVDPEVQEFFVEANKSLAKVIQDSVPGNEINNLVRIRDVLQAYSRIAAHRAEQLSALYEALNCIVTEVGRPDADLQKVFANWLQTEQRIYSALSEQERKQSEQSFNDAKSSFQTLQERMVDFEFSTREADA